MTIASLSNIIPIACILLTHWKNVGSTGKFLKLAYNIKNFAKKISGQEVKMTEPSSRGTLVCNELHCYISELSDDDDIDHVSKVMINLHRLSSQLQLKKAHDRTLSHDRGTILQQKKLSSITEDNMNLFFDDYRSSVAISINDKETRVSFNMEEDSETLLKSKTVRLNK